MTAYRRRLSLLVFAGLFGLTGASCPQFLPAVHLPAAATAAGPARLAHAPTSDRSGGPKQREDPVVRGQRRHGQRRGLSQLAGERGLPTSAAVPPSAEMTGLTGPELDLGSNDEVFWFWVRREQPPALYYCRHDQFAASPARQTLPIQPEWLIEAMGIAPFDPGAADRGRIHCPTIGWRSEPFATRPRGRPRKSPSSTAHKDGS